MDDLLFKIVRQNITFTGNKSKIREQREEKGFAGGNRDFLCVMIDRRTVTV